MLKPISIPIARLETIAIYISKLELNAIYIIGFCFSFFETYFEIDGNFSIDSFVIKQHEILEKLAYFQKRETLVTRLPSKLLNPYMKFLSLQGHVFSR